MPTPSPPRQHRYSTRSSPVTPVPSPPSTNDNLLRIREDINVKNTVIGRDSNGRRLAQHVFEGPNWNTLKETIFSHCLPYMKYKACYEGDAGVWTVQQEKPTVVDFDCFVSIKMGRYFFKPANQSQAHRYITDHQSDTFTISVLKWGNLVCSSNDLASFNQQCIHPQVHDRAGAAAESAHSEMVRRLKDKWGATYTSYEANWRMWAATILKLSLFQHDVHVANPPPAIMLHLFSPVPNGAQQRNETVQRSMIVARDIVDSCLESCATLKRFVSDVVLRIEADEASLRAKRRVIEGILQEVTPIAARPDLVELLRTIPNIEDEEHKDEANE
ncbi:hypothetical protein H310_00706 [Aphanomyces invadans]|uniref:Uncharacterized protein n=1 Tax=Aphanomyces invadans TaxID=157072 RepID=A0A024UXK3_9STRA|nr:hypothetical protein H310_00706 [Aphanomyces invadans]ETW10388.1 hypothetical protein H310_00706 [Aphanomyces invadans]|eukprot:XP_008861799.1 hypothetical protein H310_00706 [Aphanomyces invadans]